MIVFGYNNFRIKSFSPEQAGLPASENDNVSFEVRQRYFHLFWIPFFPIGKIWGMKKAGSEELYTIPYEIETIVKKNVSARTPWYSFALFFVALLAGLVYQIDDMQERQNSKDYFYNRLDESNMMIQYPTTGDFYTFSYYQSPNGSSDDIILKVKQYDDNRIQFNSVEKDFYSEIEYLYRYDMQKNYLSIEKNNYNPTYIDKEVLRSLLRDDYDKYYKDPIKIPNLEGYYTLSSIKRMELE